jgi:hypothetical protein
MAFQATLKRQTLMGNLRAQVWEVDFDGVTTGTIASGLSEVDHISFNNEVSEDLGIASKSGSNVTVSGVTSGDTGTVLIVGI